MEKQLFLDEEINRRLGALRAPDSRVSLMSVTAASVRFANLRAAVGAASAPSDTVGILGDGSIGVLSVRERVAESGFDIENNFLPRLKAALLASSHRRADNAIDLRFRAIHRWASEMKKPHDLIRTLLGTPTRSVKLLIGRPC